MRRILFASLILAATALAAESGAELFQKALTAERAAGNLEEAIKLYQRVAKEFASDRALAAKAIVQEARCYEKLGQNKAIQLYEQVARDYRDQPEPSATANARLVALKLGDRPVAPAGMTQRRMELPFPDRKSFSDGQRLYSWDFTAGRAVVSDLSGKGERTIFKLKAGDQVTGAAISRDFSMHALLLRRAGALKLAVFKMDGTGYREINSVSPSNQVSALDFSWDNRYLFLCANDADGTQQLVRLSLADGEVLKVRANDSEFNRPSPDGRFIALGAKLASPGKVLVVPSQGGEPQLVSENARLLDWTRDGRYLIVDSVRSGSEALYLLPLKDGRTAGDPIFLNYGSCTYGLTTSAGALVCSVYPPGGAYQAWLGSLDSRGHPVEWKRLDLRGNDGRWVRFSPDSTQICYLVYDAAAKTFALRLRTLAGGEEREIYRGAAALNCTWAEHRPALFCGEPGGQLSTLSLDSARLEPLGAVAGTIGTLFLAGDNDRTIYFGDGHLTLFRWDAGTQQATRVDRIPGGFKPFADKNWLARRDQDRVEIRPTAGGDWTPLVSVPPTQMVFTPDGRWVLYHDVDSTGKHGLFRVSTAGGQPERVGDFPTVRRDGYQNISPDGQKIVTRCLAEPELWILENFEPKQTAAR